MGVPYGIPIIDVAIGVDWQEAQMYFDNGALKGALKSSVGGAEYESLVGVLGLATTSIGGLSLNHLLIIFFIILGNIQFFLSRNKKGGGK